MAKKKRKVRKSSIDAATNRLLIAAGKFVDANGGNALVAGDVHITQWPGDPYRFTLCVKMTGRPPVSREVDRS